MYIKVCEWCKKTITVDKQSQFAIHIANCDNNPSKLKRNEKCSSLFKGKEIVKRIVLKQNCPKCNKEFEIKITNSEYKKNRFRKFCSRKCANSKEWTEENKKKLSDICKSSEKVKKSNKLIGEKLKLRYNKKGIEFTCLHCNKKGYDNRTGKHDKRKYHPECWLKCSGGLRKGSSRGKQGWYKGYWCDSSYELSFLIYCLEHDIKIERNYKGYKYIYHGKNHTYYPDFRVNGILTEIKNYRSELTNEKLKSVDERIDIIYTDTIKPYLKYVRNKYGNNFVELYEIASRSND